MYESASGVITSWLTPSCLFIFLNLVIATILIISRFGAPKTQIHHSPQLVRSPSLLDRVRSFNYQYEPTVAQTESPHPQLVRVPSLLERVKSFDFSLYKYQATHPETEHVQTEPQYRNPNDNPQEPQLTSAPSLLQRLQSIKVSHLYRSDSIHGEEEPEPTAGSEPETRKSASEDEDSERTVEQWRPATARSEKTWLREEEEEVDAKADDFINRFKKQLKLQRVDSILRYREMLK